MAQRNVVVDGSAVMANVLAAVVSIVVNKSAGWAFVHGILGILYLIYAFMIGDFEIFNEEMKSVFNQNDKGCETTVVAPNPSSESAAELPAVPRLE